MKTDGYRITCDACFHREFFETEEDYLEGDWYNAIDGGGHLCTDCWNEQENTRDERSAQGIAELEMLPYASAIRDNLNGEV